MILARWCAGSPREPAWGSRGAPRQRRRGVDAAAGEGSHGRRLRDRVGAPLAGPARAGADRRGPDARRGARRREPGAHRPRPAVGPRRRQAGHLRGEPSQPRRRAAADHVDARAVAARLVVGAAADYFFATRFTGALSALAMGAIPIDRTRVNRRSGDLAAELLEDDWSILIFPEGGRSPDGWGQPFRGGAAYLSVRTGAPVVPIHLEGTGRIMGQGMNRPRPGRTLVTFGKPAVSATRRRRALARRPHRRRGLPARRRGRDRLVVGAPAGGPRRDAGADRPRGTVVASGVGARRPQGPPPQAQPQLAQPRLSRFLAQRCRRWRQNTVAP